MLLSIFETDDTNVYIYIYIYIYTPLLLNTIPGRVAKNAETSE